MKRLKSDGFTLAEVVLGGAVLVVAVAAILGAYVGQVTLNEHARNLSSAIQDANRIIEEVRHQNSSCTAPTALPPAPYNTLVSRWDEWLANAVGGKSIQPNELIVVTAQNRDGTASWAPPPGDNQIRVTAAVCWRHRNRTIGECAWDGTVLSASDTNGNGVIESPAMLTTLVTCR